MNIKSPKIDVDNNNPFLNCKLSRQKYANIIVKLIESYPSGFVLALNNKWGTGKTTFIQMLQRKLELDFFPTIYFNAWEQDNETNPLNIFIGEFIELFGKKDSKKIHNLIKSAAIIVKSALPALIKGVFGKFIGDKTTSEIAEAVSKGAGDVFKNEVDAYLDRKKAIATFREDLTSFVTELSNEKPLVIFIDELDRCRPDYAVLVLEQIKHLFTIPNIIFVLSIDKIQLSNAIKGYYGSDNIDTEDYLKRFIDIEYSLPEPEFNVYYQFLLEHYKIYEIISQKGFHRPDDTHRTMHLIVEILMHNNIGKLTLRQQERFFAHLTISLSLLEPNQIINTNFFTFLTFLKFFNPVFFKGLRDKTISFESYQEHFLLEFNFETRTRSQYKHPLSLLEFTLGVAYHEFTKATNNDKLFKYNEKLNEVEILFNSKISKLPDNQCWELIKSISENQKNNLTRIFELIEMGDMFD
ncbi:P-loop NTPase fold protein [Terrimonas rubra]|uniref:P-loop NTPase fold protein n=1 Tax=Terrimonas rubra TaxID=1035890 RepID=A0ABW5ZZS4_9BACT